MPAVDCALNARRRGIRRVGPAGRDRGAHRPQADFVSAAPAKPVRRRENRPSRKPLRIATQAWRHRRRNRNRASSSTRPMPGASPSSAFPGNRPEAGRSRRCARGCEVSYRQYQATSERKQVNKSVNARAYSVGADRGRISHVGSLTLQGSPPIKLLDDLPVRVLPDDLAAAKGIEVAAPHFDPLSVAARACRNRFRNAGVRAFIAEILSPSLLPYPHPATFAGRECGIPLPRPRGEGTDRDQRSDCASLRR